MDQVHRQIVKVIFDWMRTFWSVLFTFVKTRNRFKIHSMWRFDIGQHIRHAFIELFRPNDFVILAAIHDKPAEVIGHCSPVNVRVHWTAEPNGITREQ